MLKTDIYRIHFIYRQLFKHLGIVTFKHYN